MNILSEKTFNIQYEKMLPNKQEFQIIQEFQVMPILPMYERKEVTLSQKV